MNDHSVASDISFELINYHVIIELERKYLMKLVLFSDP